MSPSPLANISLQQISELDLSPSKARAHASLSHAWSQVASWLTTLFAPAPVPPFERNPSTLSYLQALMRANISANETRRLFHDANAEQLGLYERHHEAIKDRPEQRLLRDLEDSLPLEAREALDSLTKASVTLSYLPAASTADLPSFTTTIAARLQNVTVQIFKLQNQIHDLNSLKASFERELTTSWAAIKALKATLEGEHADAEMERVHSQTTQHIREAKQISLKMNEYQDRIMVLERHVEAQQGTTIEDVKEMQSEVERKREDVERLEERLRQFQGLPPDVDASREEVRREQGEFEWWNRKREEIFEGL